MRIGGSVSAAPLAVGPHAGASSISSATTTVGSNTARCMHARSYVQRRSNAVSTRRDSVTSGRSTSRARTPRRVAAARRPEINTSGTPEPGTVDAPAKTSPGTRASTLLGPERPRLQHRVAQRPGRAALEPHRLPVERVEAALDDDVGRIAELADAALEVVGEPPAVACPVDLAVEVRHRFERVHRRAPGGRGERVADRLQGDEQRRVASCGRHA